MLAADAAVAATSCVASSSSEAALVEVDCAAAVSQSEIIVFVDESVVELAQVAEPIAAGAELVLLNSSEDGVTQIQSHLRQRQGVRQVHIVSHGSSGKLQLGAGELSNATLRDHAESLRQWGEALTSGADLLLYGCDVASDDAGKALVKELARLTGADVAASTDRTASLAAGGDWDLEYHLGVVDAPLAISEQARSEYRGHLAINDGLIGHWTLDELSATLPIIDVSGSNNTGQGNNFASPDGPNSDLANISNNVGSFQFDGVNDYISVEESESLRLVNGTYSQALWIKPTSTDDSFHGVMGYQVGSQAGGRYPFIYVRNDAIYAGFGTGGNTWKGVIADGVLSMGSWNHVAVTFDGGRMELLVNGEVVTANENFAGSLPTKTTAQLDIGRVNNHFQGQLDDVRMYNRAISQVEVQSLMQAEPPSGIIDFTTSSTTVAEDAMAVTLVLQRSVDTAGTAVVEYQVQNGSGTRGEDFLVGASGLVVFADGQETATIEIGILDDVANEESETFQVTLSAASGVNLGGATVATVTITDNDPLGLLNSGLIGYWNLDELDSDNAVRDLSGEGTHGLANNFQSPDGLTGDHADLVGNFGSYSFDGANDYVSIGEDESLRLIDGTYSQALWIKPTSQDDKFHGVIGYQAGASAGSRYPFIYVRNTSIYAGFGTGGNAWKGVIADDVLSIGSWNHVAVTFDGSAMSVLVDGQVVGTNASFAGSKPTTSVARLDIGRVNSYFQGQLDDVRMYNRSLSQLEIDAIRGAGSLSTAGAIGFDVAQVSVDESAGTVAIGLTRVGGTEGAVEVFYQTSALTATGDGDFGSSAGSISFEDGQVTATIEIDIIDDQDSEGDEKFELQLTGVDGADLRSPSRVAVTIEDDDDPEPDLAGLVGHWALDETSTLVPIADLSTAGNDGEANNFSSPNGPSSDAADILGNVGSFQFDGVNDFISVDQSESLRLVNGTYSQALWIKPTSADDSFRGVIGYQVGSQAGGRYPFIYVRSDAIYAGFGTGGNTWKGVIADGVLSIGSWNHVAVTFDGGRMELLVNGEVVTANENFAGSLPTKTTAQLDIGRVNNYFQGQLDDVRMYNRAISKAEVEALLVKEPPVQGVGQIGLAATQVTVKEDAGTAAIGLRRINGTDGPAEVFFQTQDASALDGVDYIGSVSGSVQFVDGQEYGEIVIPLIDNADADGEKKFQLSLFRVEGAVQGEPRTVTITIVDDESGSGLIGYWNLNETTTSVPILDSSGIGNDGVAMNFASPAGPTLTAPDTISPNPGSFRFDGANDYIDVSEDESLRLTEGRYSQAVWIKPTSYDDNYHGIIGYQAGSSIGTRYPFVYVRNDAIYAGFGTGGSTWKGVVADGVITINAWNHVAVTFDGAVMDLYVNGELVQSNNNFAGALPTTEHATLNIGRVNNYFVGQIDEVRMYDRALSGSEVRNLIDGATLPPPKVVGYFTAQTFASGLVQPTTIERLPDGRFLVAEREGIIRVVNQDGSVNPTPLLDISDIVNRVGVDRGLMSIVVPPDFATSRQIYVAYTYDPPEVQGLVGNGGPDGEGGRVARVGRFTVDESWTVADRNSEVVVLGNNSTYENIGQPNRRPLLSDPQSGIDENGNYIPDFIASDELSHTVGDMEFGADGALYVSVGDGGSYGRVDPVNLRSLDINSLNGKILRVDPLTGKGLPDNPFYDGDPNSNASRVYSYGLRNPFRFAINPSDGEVFIADVGWLNWEEINTGRGKNFGWPAYEGLGLTGGDRGSYSSLPEVQEYLATEPLITPPIWTRSHSAGAVAIIMGDFIQGGDYPESLQGAFLFTDIGDRVLRAGRLDADGALIDVIPVSSSLGFITDVMRMSDGSLFYTDFVSGTIGKLIFNG